MGVLFIRQEKLPNPRVREIENSVRQLISEGYAVSRRLMPLQQALNSEDVVTVPNEVSLSAVTAVAGWVCVGGMLEGGSERESVCVCVCCEDV